MQRVGRTWSRRRTLVRRCVYQSLLPPKHTAPPSLMACTCRMGIAAPSCSFSLECMFEQLLTSTFESM